MSETIRIERGEIEYLTKLNCDHVIFGSEEQHCDLKDEERGGCCNSCWTRRWAERKLQGQDEGEWQPIDTAPKDGTEILTCNMNQGGIMRLIYWYRTTGQWRTKGAVIVCLQDTHWMPLPQKPGKED